MKTANICREIEGSVKAVRNRHLERLQVLSVTSTTIARLGTVQPPFGVMDCEIIAGGFFQPGGTKSYIVQPVYDDAVIVDIIAWRTAEPRKWFWRTGAAWALNTNAIAESGWHDEPLAIVGTPLDWLRNGAKGLCILNWDAPEIQQLLRINSITADRHIARQLQAALMKPVYFPAITIAKGDRNAA